MKKFLDILFAVMMLAGLFLASIGAMGFFMPLFFSDDHRPDFGMYSALGGLLGLLLIGFSLSLEKRWIKPVPTPPEKVRFILLAFLMAIAIRAGLEFYRDGYFIVAGAMLLLFILLFFFLIYQAKKKSKTLHKSPN